MAPSPRISVVVVALNESSELRRTVENFQATLPPETEIVVVDDGSDDGCSDFLAAENAPARLIKSDHIGVANARNLGARQTSGEVIFFADAHLAMEAGWWAPMVELLANPCAGGVAPVISDMTDRHCKGYGLELAGPDPSEKWLPRRGDEPCQAPLLPWCCTAMRRDVFEATGGFDGGMICWGSIDNEMSLRLWLLGYELWLSPQSDVFHLFREERPYHVEWRWAVHNKLRLAFVHFSLPRVERVVSALREHDAFPSAIALMVEENIAARRAELAARRVHDDEWYFARFGPQW